MEYQKIINLLLNETSQQSKFREKRGSGKTIMHVEHITSIVTLNLRLPC